MLITLFLLNVYSSAKGDSEKPAIPGQFAQRETASGDASDRQRVAHLVVQETSIFDSLKESLNARKEILEQQNVQQLAALQRQLDEAKQINVELHVCTIAIMVQMYEATGTSLSDEDAERKLRQVLNNFKIALSKSGPAAHTEPKKPQ